MLKKCTKCKEHKNLENFQKDCTKSDGHHTRCKTCKNFNRKRKTFEIVNLEFISCKKCNKNKSKDCFDRDIYSSTGLAPKCKNCRKEDTQKDYENNREIKKQKSIEYYNLNKAKVLKSQLERQKKRLKTDIQYKLTRNLRNRLYYALQNKNWKKNTKFTQYIGCSREELITHLEIQFKDNMSWDNYGKWHIDHIIPLDSAKTEQELYELCEYTNLQPMWAVENIKKSNKIYVK